MRLKIDLVSYPARVEGLVNRIIQERNMYYIVLSRVEKENLPRIMTIFYAYSMKALWIHIIHLPSRLGLSAER